jgi:hypothetical protein
MGCPCTLRYQQRPAIPATGLELDLEAGKRADGTIQLFLNCNQCNTSFYRFELGEYYFGPGKLLISGKRLLYLWRGPFVPTRGIDTIPAVGDGVSARMRIGDRPYASQASRSLSIYTTRPPSQIAPLRLRAVGGEFRSPGAEAPHLSWGNPRSDSINPPKKGY